MSDKIDEVEFMFVLFLRLVGWHLCWSIEWLGLYVQQWWNPNVAEEIQVLLREIRP